MDKGRQHALIVDDSATERLWEEKLLVNLGCCVDAVEDGTAALKFLLSHGTVDLVMLDLNMPRMNGHEFLDEVSKYEALKGIKIIVLSGKDEAEVIPCLDEGAADYWLKGSGIKVLKHKLRQLLYTASLENKLARISAIIQH